MKFFKILMVAACLCLSAPFAAHAAESQCTTAELDLVCDDNEVLKGINADGTKICVSSSFTSLCRTTQDSYGDSGLTLTCEDDEFMLGLTISDEGDARDLKEITGTETGVSARVSGSGGWARAVCCKDSLF